MANRRQKKKAAKMAAEYNQSNNRTYRGRELPAPKPLTRLENGNIINEHGVMLTKDEARRMENLVNQVNAKRRAMQEATANLPRKHAGKELGDTLGSLHIMGKEDEFIVARRTASIQRFQSKEQFDNYLGHLEKTLDPNYVTERARQYKRNFMNSLRDVYGDEAKDILMKVRMMKPEAYMQMVEQDEVLEIRYAPSDVHINGRLNQLRQALGMKLKDDWPDEEYDV